MRYIRVFYVLLETRCGCTKTYKYGTEFPGHEIAVPINHDPVAAIMHSVNPNAPNAIKNEAPRLRKFKLASGGDWNTLEGGLVRYLEVLE